MAENQGSVEEVSSSFLSDFASEVFYNPLNVILLAICGYILYKILGGSKQEVNASPYPPPLPPMKRKDMTNQELRQYDGTNEDGRICVAVNGRIFDVTRARHLYGTGGSYAAFAGKDATRCLATFSLDSAADDYDDLSDLDTMQMDSVREWEAQFEEKYKVVGRLLKPGEEPNEYSDEEEATQS